MATDWALASNGAACKCGPNNTWPNNAPNAIDGNEATYNGPANVADPYPNYHIDVGSTHTIHVVGLKQSASAGYKATHFQVKVSTNDTDWTTVLDIDVPNDDWEYEITPVAARYWRFIATTGVTVGWNVYTLHLWDDGTAVPTPPTGSLESDAFYKLSVAGPRMQLAWAAYTSAPVSYDPEYVNFCVAMWNNYLLNDIIARLDDLGGGGGSEATLDDIYQQNVNTQSQISATQLTLETEILGNRAVLMPEGVLPGTTLYGQANSIYETQWAESNARRDAILLNDNTNTSALVTLSNDQTMDINTNTNDKVDDATSTINLAIGAATTLITGAVTLAHTATDAAIAAVAAQCTAILAAIAGLGGGLASSIIDGITEWLLANPTTPQSNLWPGLADVSLLAPWTIAGPENIPGPMDGCLVEVLSVPAGQSRQAAAGAYRYKGVGWVAFMTETGHWEPLQQIGCSKGVYIPLAIARATRLAVYCKAGATMKVTPWLAGDA